MSITPADVSAHIDELRRYARQLTRNTEAADDLLQETLTRALGKLDLYEPSGSLKGWLCTIMKNLFFDQCRRRQKWPTSSYVEHEHGSRHVIGPNQIDSLIMGELRVALMRLSPEHRAMLMAVVAHGWSYEQVSEHFDVPVGTVRSRLFRARTALMEMLDPPERPARSRRRPAQERPVLASSRNTGDSAVAAALSGPTAPS